MKPKTRQRQLAEKALALKRQSGAGSCRPDPGLPSAPDARLRWPHRTRLPQSRAPPPDKPELFPGQDDRDVLLSREEVAAYLRCSLPTLELWARNGEGPRMVRVGRAIRYRLSDVRAFIEAGASAVTREA